MRQVYNPKDSIEAHMLVHMLSEEGIQAEIHGEFLQGAMGELPMNDLIKIMVADEDYEKARQLLLDWEKKNPPVTNEETDKQVKGKCNVFSWYICLLIGGAAGWLAHAYIPATSSQEHQSVVEYDDNNDGKMDTVVTYRDNGTPRKMTLDRNFDGKTDATTSYDIYGRVDSTSEDADFDGFYETRSTYQQGQMIETRQDTDKDGKVEITYIYEDGKHSQTHWDTNNDDKADMILQYQSLQDYNVLFINPKSDKTIKIQYFRANKLKTADYDADGDGFLETRYRYDQYEEISGQEKNEKQ